MIARMNNDGLNETNTDPYPECQQVAAKQEWSRDKGEQVGDYMFYGMSIHRCKPNRGCPFMMQFVDMFVLPEGLPEGNKRATEGGSLERQ